MPFSAIWSMSPHRTALHASQGERSAPEVGIVNDDASGGCRQNARCVEVLCCEIGCERNQDADKDLTTGFFPDTPVQLIVG